MARWRAPAALTDLVLRRVFLALEDYLADLQARLDDHEDRISSLEP